MRSKDYKLILFDLGGVLFTNGTKKFIEALANRYHFDHSQVKEIIDGKLGSLYRTSQISRDEFWAQVIAQLKLNESTDEPEKEWISYYEIIHGTKEIIQKLSKKYKVFYLSGNTKERAHALEEKFCFSKWFHDGLFSYEAGTGKIDAGLYKLVLKKAKVSAKETIYIDDKQEMLIPAKKLGMTTILFEGGEKLREELHFLNV